jgi:MFS family permease
MCISQPILFRLSHVFHRKSVVLASIVMLGVGSMVSESANAIALLLLGRTVQGFGAGGLTVLSYALYGDLPHSSGLKFLAAISFSVAAGTVSGPLVGAALSNGNHWVRSFQKYQSCRLTVRQALDFSYEHPFVPSARSARIQFRRHPNKNL